MQMSIRSLRSPFYQRLTEAALGFAVTALPLAVIGTGQFLLARHTVLVVGGLNPDVDTWAVPQFRSSLTYIYALVACLLTTYWLIAAAMSRGQFLAIRSANVTLALSCLAFGCGMAVASAIPAPATFFDVACPYLGFSDTYPKFGFDAPTACEAFTYTALQTLLLGLPVLLLAMSAILRVYVSRYRHSTYVR